MEGKKKENDEENKEIREGITGKPKGQGGKEGFKVKRNSKRRTTCFTGRSNAKILQHSGFLIGNRGWRKQSGHRGGINSLLFFAAEEGK